MLTHGKYGLRTHVGSVDLSVAIWTLVIAILALIVSLASGAFRPGAESAIAHNINPSAAKVTPSPSGQKPPQTVLVFARNPIGPPRVSAIALSPDTGGNTQWSTPEQPHKPLGAYSLINIGDHWYVPAGLFLPRDKYILCEDYENDVILIVREHEWWLFQVGCNYALYYRATNSLIGEFARSSNIGSLLSEQAGAITFDPIDVACPPVRQETGQGYLMPLRLVAGYAGMNPLTEVEPTTLKSGEAAVILTTNIPLEEIQLGVQPQPFHCPEQMLRHFPHP
jgi:hypothetical protein